MEAFQAERALTVWKDILNEFLKRPEHFGGYKMTAEAADDLVAELIVATRRLGLEARIRTALERWNFSLLSERRALPASTVAASEINAFVARLGMDELGRGGSTRRGVRGNQPPGLRGAARAICIPFVAGPTEVRRRRPVCGLDLRAPSPLRG